MIYLDLETDNPVAGAEPDPVTDRIISIGIYESISRQRFIDPDFTRLTRTEIHGITPEMLADAPTFRVVARSLHGSLAKHTQIVTYNGLRYDIPLLYEEFNRAGIEWDTEAHEFIDLAACWVKMEPRKLTDAVRRFAGYEHVDAHSALADARVLVDVMEGMRKSWGAYRPEQADEDPLAIDPLISASFRTVMCGGKELPLADLNGTTARDENGRLVFATKRNRGVAVLDDPGYAHWLLRQSFVGAHARRVIEEELERLELFQQDTGK